jgi:DNA segregation ATPase FtsK/SpoIIIE, S-DNA-T family
MTEQQTEIAQANGHAATLPTVEGTGATFPGPRTTTDTPPPAVAADAEDDASAPVSADPHPMTDPAPLPWAVPDQRKPVVPEWVRDSAQRSAAFQWALRWTGHAAAFHAVRVPKYAVRAGTYMPRGAVRAMVRWVRWILDWDAHSLRLDLIQKREASAYHVAARHRDDRVKNRAIGSVAAAAASLVGAYVATRAWGPSLDLLLAAGAGTLVWNGRPVGVPFLIDYTVTPASVTKLTTDVVARALGSLGIAELRKAFEKHDLVFPAPIVRDGNGWRAAIDLPHGITAVDVIEKRRELSSGLRRPLGCVWPQPVEEEHSGSLVLWVGDRTLAKSPAAVYPLLERGTTDMFGPLPFGTDQRSRAQTVCLMFASMACGAQPRQGKTVSIRVLALGASLDVACELHVYDGKGMGDWVMFELVAHTFLSGSRTETLMQLRDALAELKNEVDRRAILLTKLTREGKCREGKITPELSKIKAFRLHPILIVLDECHLAFDTGTGPAGKLGEEITGLSEYLVRVGPAAGVSVIAATQRPDAKSLPSGIRANVQLRFALRVADQPTNDMVMGTSAYKNGVRATEFALSDKGIGYLAGEGAAPVIVRGYNVDADGATKILTRARAAREAAGTLSGVAAGLEPEHRNDPAVLLADVLAVIGDEEQMWSEAICQRLADVNPGQYAGWDATTLGKALRAQGVTPRQTWWTPPEGTPGNRNGVKREQVTEALAKIRENSAKKDAN